MASSDAAEYVFFLLQPAKIMPCELANTSVPGPGHTPLNDVSCRTIPQQKAKKTPARFLAGRGSVRGALGNAGPRFHHPSCTAHSSCSLPPELWAQRRLFSATAAEGPCLLHDSGDALTFSRLWLAWE